MVNAADMQRPSELSKRFDVSKLMGHFVVGRSVPIEPPGWLRRESDGWTLLHEPSLPVHELLDSAGAEIGWLLGHPIDLEAETMVVGATQATVLRDAENFARGFEDWLYGLGGRFVAIVLHPTPTLFPDAGATLPVLFNAKSHCAASSPFLLFPSNDMIIDSALVEALAIFETGLSFQLGTIPVIEADRLRPNHVLDLARWEQSRIWPSSPFESGDVDCLVERVASTLEKTLAALVTVDRPNVGLTAGGDSRVLLACSKRFVDRMQFFTVAFPDDLGAIDLTTVPHLANRFSLQHRVLPWVEPSSTDVALFMYRTGCLTGESRGRLAAPSYNQLGGDCVYVSSVGAEMAREIGYNRYDSLTTLLKPADLVSRFDFILGPGRPELTRRADEWLAGIPAGLSRSDTLTLFYAELDNEWGASLTTGYPDAYSWVLYPFMHRSILDAVLRLPPEYRMSGRLREDVVTCRWMELLDVPINRPPLRVRARRAGRKMMRLGRAGLSLRGWKRLYREVRARSGV